MEHPDLSAIVVAYRSGADLDSCLASIERELAAEGLRGEIVVVDNAPEDGSVARATRGRGIAVLSNRRNLGFGAAVNQGWRNSSADRVLLLNPDAELLPGSLRSMLDGLRDAALVGPTLVLRDGQRQDNPRRFYDLPTVLARRTPFGRTAAGRRYLALHTLAASGADVDWVTGAAMMLRRDAAAAAGPFDERYFLYFEDVDLCRRLGAAGRPVRFVADARVRHGFARASYGGLWNPLRGHHLRSGLRYGLRWSAARWRSRWWRAPAARVAGLAGRAALVALAAASAGVAGAPLLALTVAGAALTDRPADRVVATAPRPGLLRTLAALGLGVALSALAGLSPTPELGASLAFVGLGLHGLRRRRQLRGTILLAGSGAEADRVQRALLQERDSQLSVAGFVPLDPSDPAGPSPRLPDWARVVDCAADLRADAVVIAGSADELAAMAGGVHALRRAGVEAVFVLTGAEELLQADAPSRLAGLPVLPLGSGASATVLAGLSQLGGRIAALLGLAALAPAVPVLLGLASLAARGVPLLASPRVGQHGRPFTMWKLRSGPDDEQGGGRLGALLRRLHLDELPQLVNVVRGDMALVGPRPVSRAVADRLDASERARFAVPPGITGMWQLDRLRRWRLEEMIVADLLYVLRWSPALDLRILAETVLGRRTP